MRCGLLLKVTMLSTCDLHLVSTSDVYDLPVVVSITMNLTSSLNPLLSGQRAVSACRTAPTTPNMTHWSLQKLTMFWAHDRDLVERRHVLDLCVVIAMPMHSPRLLDPCVRRHTPRPTRASRRAWQASVTVKSVVHRGLLELTMGRTDDHYLGGFVDVLDP